LSPDFNAGLRGGNSEGSLIQDEMKQWMSNNGKQQQQNDDKQSTLSR